MRLPKLKPNLKLISIPVLIIIGTIIAVISFSKKPKVELPQAPRFNVKASNPQSDPSVFFLDAAELNKLPDIKVQSDKTGFLAYHVNRVGDQTEVYLKSRDGIQKYIFSTDNFSVKLQEYEKNSQISQDKGTAIPVFQYLLDGVWKNYEAGKINIKVSQKDNLVTVSQIATIDGAALTAVWQLGVKDFGVSTKNTFTISGRPNRQHRLIWNISLPKTVKADLANYELKPEAKFLRAGNIEIDWSDFTSISKASYQKDQNILSITFLPDGQTGDLLVDPSFTTTVGADWIEIYDGTRTWCMGRGPDSTASTYRFFQPALFYHDTTGNPTACNNGGDNLLPGGRTGDQSNYDGFFADMETSVTDSANNTLSILETTGSRTVIQAFRGDIGTQDSYAYYTLYPNGIQVSDIRIASVSAIFAYSGLYQHYDESDTAPQVTPAPDTTTDSFVISDSTNDYYPGLASIPFSIFNFYPTDTGDSNSTADYWGYYNAAYAGGDAVNIHRQYTHLADWSEYRASQYTRAIRLADFSTPDNITDGLNNLNIWDKAGPQALITYTGFEGADPDLCSGAGDGFSISSCNAGDTFVGNDTTYVYSGNYAARVTTNGDAGDSSYVQTDPFHNSIIKSIYFAFRINSETLADGNSAAIAFSADLTGIGTAVWLNQNAGSLRFCVADQVYGSPNCGTTAVQPGTWYQLLFVRGANLNSLNSYTSRLYLNGVLEANYTAVDVSTHKAFSVGMPDSSTGVVLDFSFDDVAVNLAPTHQLLGHSANDAAYTLEVDTWGEDLALDLDRSGYTASASAFLIRNWQKSTVPAVIKLENSLMTRGTEYNSDVLPMSESHVFDSDGSGYKRLADGGDTADADEYLYDTTNDFSFNDATYTWGNSSSDYLYFGRTDQYSGLNSDLSTVGIGTASVVWQYCSANTDIATACDTWTALTTTGNPTGASNFTASGNIHFTPPSQWIRSTENSGRSGLFYIRAYVTSGSYTTYPVENQITSDILLIQHMGTITTNDQTFDIGFFDGAHWRLDEGKSTSAQDVNGNHLTLSTSSVWKTDPNSKSNRQTYIALNGSSQYASKTAEADFNPGTGSFTLSGWFRHSSSISGTDTLLSHYGQAGYKIYLNSSGYLCFAVDDDSSWGPDYSTCTTISFADSTWHHFAAVKNANSTLTLYVDGQPRAYITSISSLETLDTNSTFYLGVDSNGSSNYWDGAVDDIALYTTAYTQAQVQTDYQAGAAAQFAAQATNPLENGLMGYWKLDESSGNAADTSGNGYTLTNNSTTTYVAGKFGNGSEHVPASFQHFSTVSTISGIKSFSFWANPDSTTNYYLSLTSGAYLTSTSGTLATTGLSGAQIYVNGVKSTNISADIWQHITVTFDSAINADLFYLGRQGTNYFDGTLDEVRLYSRTLTPNEVAQLYTWTAGPLAHWKLDENTGTSAFDTSGNSIDGVLTNGPLWEAGKFGSAVRFSNTITTQSVLMEENVLTDNLKQFTYTAWIKPSALDAAGSYILAKNSQKKLLIYNPTGTDFRVKGIVNYAGDDMEIATTTTSNLAVDTWYHVAFTWDGSATHATNHVYLNGVDQAHHASSVDGTSTLDDDSGGPFKMANSGANTSPFKGVVDDVRVYDYVRTPAQIIQDMNAGHLAPGSPVGSTTGHWKFDEGYSTTAYDDSINQNNLTLSAAGWTNSGKFGKAYDGADNRRLSRSDDDDFDFTTGSDSFTISLWFNRGGTISNAEYLFDKHSTNDGYTLYMDSDGDIVCGIGDGTSFPEDTAGTNSANYDDTNWHHAVCVKDGTSSLTLYIDGIKVSDDQSLAANGDMSNAGTLYIGDANGTDGTDEWLGDIDEIKFYRLAMTADQVKTEYSLGFASSMGSLSTTSTEAASNTSADSYCPPGQGSTCVPPVAEWLFDENTGIYAYDTSTNGNTGTLTNGPVWRQGKFGSSLFFDGAGTADDYIDAGSNTAVDDIFDGGGTITFWINPKSSGESTAGRVIVKGGANTGYIVRTTLCDSNSVDLEIIIDHTTDGVYRTNCVLPISRWSHVSIIYDDDNYATDPIFYLNGALQTFDTITDPSGYASDGAQTLYIGSGTGTGVIDAYLDTLRFYNYALSPAQIAWNYNHGKPAAWYKFDETSWTANCSTDTVFDSSGNNLHADSCPNTTGQTTPETGQRNNSMHFDDSDDYVTTADTTALDLTSGLTISAWVNTDANEADNVIVSKGTSYEMGINADGDVYWDGVGAQVDDGSAKVLAGSWHHVVVVNNDSTATVYVDGKPTAVLSAGVDADNSTALYVGYDGTNYFDGLIDEVKIYNYPMTQKQVELEFTGSAVSFR